MNSTPASPDGSHLQEWQKEPSQSLIERVRRLPTVSALNAIALPDRQIHLMFGPVIDPLLKTAASLCTSREATVAFALEVNDWVRWDRKVGYGLAAVLATVCAGSALETYPRMLLSMAQTSYGHDSAVVNLDEAYGLMLTQDPGRTKMKPLWTLADMLVLARFSYVSDFGRSRPYRDYNPIVANLYSNVTFGAFVLQHPEVLGEGGTVDTMRLAAFVDQSADDHDAYWQVIGGRILGDVLGAMGDIKGSLAARQRALDTALACEITTEIGHLRRVMGSTMITVGLDRRREGNMQAAMDMFQAAEVELQAAAEFENEPGCEYWAALSHYRLGDAQRYFDDLAFEMASHDRALSSYARGRSLLEQHLSAQMVPADRAVKKQIFSSFSATALRTAFALGRQREVLAQVTADGSATASDLEQELEALRGLNDEMRASFAATRGIYHLEMTAVEGGVAAYEKLLRDHHEECLRYYVGKHWMRSRPHVDAEILVDRVAESLPDGTAVFTLDPCQHDSYSVAFDRNAHHLHASRLPDLTEPGCAAAQDTFARALEIAKHSPAGAHVVITALGALLHSIPESLSNVLSYQLTALPNIERIVLLPHRQLSSFPWHALEIDGRPLLERCEVVYGHSIEMLSILQQRQPIEGDALHTTMVYDDIGADFFESLAEAGSSIGIERILRNPAWHEIEALGPITRPASSGEPDDSLIYAPLSSGERDPLLGHFLIYAPIGEGAALPEDEPLATRTTLQDLFFACHGDYDPQDPFSSGLLLDDQTRTIDFVDILTKLDLSAWRGVVLGACETGLARRELATEQVSLGSAFLAAGVDYVITSLWPVDRLATTILFDDFFTRLRSGSTFPGALRSAALTLRGLSADALVAWAQKHLPGKYVSVAQRRAQASGHPFSHPYYWAGFIVTGRP